MTIKPPASGDIPGLTRLWQQAFGDPADFIEGFFRTGFSENRCMLAEEKGQLLAGLYWFDCLWEDKKIAYLYAIATDENHRGKGICKTLMEHTHQTLLQKGYAGAILVPADEGLARMYGKMGYTACCPVAKPEGLEISTKIDEISPEEYRKLRPNYLPKGAAHHTEAAYRYLATFQNFYRFPGGILCGSISENRFHLQELLPVGTGVPHGPETAMCLSFTETPICPTYFALSMG